MVDDRIRFAEIWGRGREVRIESPFGPNELAERLHQSIGRPLAGPFEGYMPDTEPVKPLQGSVSGLAFHLRAPLRVSAFQRGYRPELVGTVVANGAGGSSILGTVRIVWWQQVLYPALTLAMLTCVFILGGPIGLVVLAFGAALGLVWSARSSTERAADVISATSRAAAPLP